MPVAEEEDAGPADAGVYYPGTLAETGLYADPANETLAPGVQPYEPEFALWSDSAEKKRYLYLPPGAQIDTSDMDGWVFPVGTKAWKEFTRDGTRVETRLLEKREDGWFVMAYAWNAAQTEAVIMENGEKNANGTQHDIPNAADCGSCHDGAADRLLGVSAIQLSHDRAGLNLTQLIAAGQLSQPPSGNFVIPGSPEARAALGALHANCGSCHNPRGLGLDRAKDLLLWLTVDSLSAGTVEATTTYRTTVSQPVQSKELPGVTQLIVPGQPDQSGLLLRQSVPRTDKLTMPPLASELSDTATTTAVSAWILAL